MKHTLLVALLLTGCTEAHTIPPDDAGTCTDPHPDCVVFECAADESIGWHFPHGCDNPQLLEYAECNWWLRHGTPCGSGGTCAIGYTGLCEGER